MYYYEAILKNVFLTGRGEWTEKKKDCFPKIFSGEIFKILQNGVKNISVCVSVYTDMDIHTHLYAHTQSLSLSKGNGDVISFFLQWLCILFLLPETNLNGVRECEWQWGIR